MPFNTEVYALAYTAREKLCRETEHDPDLRVLAAHANLLDDLFTLLNAPYLIPVSAAATSPQVPAASQQDQKDDQQRDQQRLQQKEQYKLRSLQQKQLQLQELRLQQKQRELEWVKLQHERSRAWSSSSRQKHAPSTSPSLFPLQSTASSTSQSSSSPAETTSVSSAAPSAAGAGAAAGAAMSKSPPREVPTLSHDSASDTDTDSDSDSDVSDLSDSEMTYPSSATNLPINGDLNKTHALGERRLARRHHHHRGTHALGHDLPVHAHEEEGDATTAFTHDLLMPLLSTSLTAPSTLHAGNLGAGPKTDVNEPLVPLVSHVTVSFGIGHGSSNAASGGKTERKSKSTKRWGSVTTTDTGDVTEGRRIELLY